MSYFKCCLLAIAGTFLFLIPAVGQNISVGAGIGNGFNKKRLGDLNGEDFRIKESSLAWKVFASTGWRFLGAEGGFRQFSEIRELTPDGIGFTKSRGGDIFGRGVFQLGIFSAFGKAGVFFRRTKNELYNSQNERIVNEVKRQTAFAWGFGGAVRFWKMQVRLEYENMEVNPDNLGMLSLGVLFGVYRND